MIVHKGDPYGARQVVKPGHAMRKGGQVPRIETMDKLENIRRCQACDVPRKRCRGVCRSDEDQARARGRVKEKEAG